MKGKLERIRLQGLELAPAQGWRGVRIAPILRRQAPGQVNALAHPQVRRQTPQVFGALGQAGGHVVHIGGRL